MCDSTLSEGERKVREMADTLGDVADLVRDGDLEEAVTTANTLDENTDCALCTALKQDILSKIVSVQIGEANEDMAAEIDEIGEKLRGDGDGS